MIYGNAVLAARGMCHVAAGAGAACLRHVDTLYAATATAAALTWKPS